MDLHSRLQELDPTIRRLMKLGGTPGLSLSVATKNQPVYHANYGYRDVDAGLPVTEKTIFPACSLSKGLSAAAMGILVEKGDISWSTRVADSCPSYRPRDTFMRVHTTVKDLYSHRSGMSSCGNLVNGCEGNVLIGKKDCMRVVNKQVLLPAQLGKFSYNSTAYDVCDAIIEGMSGLSLGRFLWDNVFDVLGLERTWMSPPPEGTDDVAVSYNALDDATPCCIPSPKLGENSTCSGSGGLHSCAVDLIKLYSSLVKSFNSEFETGQTSTPESPFKKVSRIMSAHVPMFETAKNEISYGLGWARVQLPNTMGHIGLNGRLMPSGMPVVGNGVPSQLVLYHQGTLPGALSVVILVPETESVILVMSNCLALTDVPDWTSQMVLEELLGVPKSHKTNFLPYSENSILINLRWHDSLVQDLEKLRPKSPIPHRELKSYVGTFVAKSRVFSVTVTIVGGYLCWAFQGLESERYTLAHYSGDAFTWLQPRNVLSRRGRWVLGNDLDPSFWLVQFKAGDHGKLDKVLWKHDPLQEPIVYSRE